MNKLRKAAEMALEALSKVMLTSDKGVACENAAKALRQALAQPVDAVNISEERVDEKRKGEHEPVAFVNGYFGGYLTITCFDPTLILPDGLALYTAPPKKEWVGLSDEEILDCWKQAYEPGHREHMNAMNMARTVESKLKDKST